MIAPLTLVTSSVSLYFPEPVESGPQTRPIEQRVHRNPVGQVELPRASQLLRPVSICDISCSARSWSTRFG